MCYKWIRSYLFIEVNFSYWCHLWHHNMSRFTLWNQFLVQLISPTNVAILIFLPMKNYPPNYHIFSLIYFWIFSNLMNLHLSKILHFQISLDNNFDCVFNFNLQCLTMLIKFRQCWSLTTITTFVNISTDCNMIFLYYDSTIFYDASYEMILYDNVLLPFMINFFLC